MVDVTRCHGSTTI